MDWRGLLFDLDWDSDVAVEVHAWWVHIGKVAANERDRVDARRAPTTTQKRTKFGRLGAGGGEDNIK